MIPSTPMFKSQYPNSKRPIKLTTTDLLKAPPLSTLHFLLTLLLLFPLPRLPRKIPHHIVPLLIVPLILILIIIILLVILFLDVVEWRDCRVAVMVLRVGGNSDPLWLLSLECFMRVGALSAFLSYRWLLGLGGCGSLEQERTGQNSLVDLLQLLLVLVLDTGC